MKYELSAYGTQADLRSHIDLTFNKALKEVL